MADICFNRNRLRREMAEMIPELKEPDTLSAALSALAASHPPGSRLHELGADLLRSHAINRERRAAVLKYEDLSKRLVTELGYANPRQWNGYIPPAVIDPGDPGGMCSGAVLDGRGGVRFVFNQLGRRAVGERPNDSPQRAILVEISREAWDRERAVQENL